jgi:hypothetical protein
MLASKGAPHPIAGPKERAGSVAGGCLPAHRNGNGFSKFTKFTDSRGGVEGKNRIIIEKRTHPHPFIENRYYITVLHH